MEIVHSVFTKNWNYYFSQRQSLKHHGKNVEEKDMLLD
jgi:hypothetical protein